MSVGYVYILSNPAMPGLLKIGFTNRDVKERVAELSAMTGVPKPFEIEYYCLTSDVEEIEGTVHRHFSSKREQGKEFFSAAPVEVVELIDSLVKKVEPDRFCRVTLQQGSPCPQRWLRCRTCDHEWSIQYSVDPPCPKCGWHIADRLREGPTKNV